jgi:hypothetical protein
MHLNNSEISSKPHTLLFLNYPAGITIEKKQVGQKKKAPFRGIPQRKNTKNKIDTGKEKFFG